MKRKYHPNISIHSTMLPGISDEESLLLQLCHYLYESGFLFHDATLKEIEAGQLVIQSFYEQEGTFIMQILSEDLLNKFIHYVQEHSWNKEEIEKKIRLKMVKAFDQLAKGTSHSWNIQRNIHLGLLQFPQNVLQDFLLYLAAYHHYLLETPPMDAAYTIEDVMRLREELVERLEGHKFVDWLLNDISRQRGGHLPLEEESFRNSIQFIRPNQRPSPSISAPSAQNPPVLPQASATVAESLPASKEPQAPAPPLIEEKIEEEEEALEDLQFGKEPEEKDRLDETDVVYGTGTIDQEAIEAFIQKHTDSALKFLLGRELNGKILSKEVVMIHKQWETRGLKRAFIRRCILEWMGWEEWPKNQTISEISDALKDRLYDLSGHL